MEAPDTRSDFPALPDGRRVFFEAFAAATRPAENLTISEHADRYRVVSAESGSPWPGPFRTSRVPYLREPQDCLHPDSPVRRVTARWAAQLGKSTALENWFCYVVDQAPGSMMIILPTLDEATKFNRVKLQPTIDATPRIAHKVAPANSRDEAASTTAFKRFAGGFCQIVNAGSSKGLQMVSIKYLAMDEITGYPRDVDGRGSPRDQARARQKMYGDYAKEWQGSTPGVAGECAITADFEAGDQRFYYVGCPHCAVYQALEFPQMRGPSDDMPTHFLCVACNEPIFDGHKPEMLAGGVWIARRMRDGAPPVPQAIPAGEIDAWRCAPREGRCRDWEPSYHLWAAYAPREKWGDIWKRYVESEADTTKRRVFCQQDLAEPYDASGVAVEWESIVAAARKEGLAHGVVPRGAGLLVSAADVQGYGIKWVVYALGPRGQRWLVDREVFEGAPDQSDEPWIALADALGRRYQTSAGGEIGIDLSGVDSGFTTNRVYRFCSSRPNCFALDGRHAPGLPWLGTPSKRSIKGANGRQVAKALLYPVGNYDVKTEVVAGLANFVQGPSEAGHWPRNTLHLPPSLCDEAFAREMTSERLVDPEETISANARRQPMIKARAGREWKKLFGRQNDWFDATVYALAIGWHLEQRRRLTNLDRWDELLAAVHGSAAPPADLFDPFETKSQPATQRRRIGREKWKQRK